MPLRDPSRFLGRWAGRKLLRQSWQPEPESESPSTLHVAPVARGRFVELTYTWEYQGEPQEGLLLVGVDEEANEGAWVDSWHQSRAIMVCRSITGGAAALTLLGSYPAGEGGDWGWRITLDLVEDDRLRIEMHNISPDGDEELAVRADYERDAGPA